MIGMQRRWSLIGNLNNTNFPRTLDRDAAGAGLWRLLSIEFRDRFWRTRDCAEILFDQAKRHLGLEIADDRDGGVIRPIERIIEFAEFFDRDLLDVGTPADRRMMIRVRNERGGPHFLV